MFNFLHTKYVVTMIFAFMIETSKDFLQEYINMYW